MDSHAAIRDDELLQQMGWVQALARRLVRDPNLADDIAQQAWLTALERPPRSTTGPSLRAWLASVTRTLARQSQRTESRRTQREQRAAAARPDRDEAALDVVARGERHRRIVDHVLALDEPYRSTILMRFLDGLSGPEIAERSGASHAAVRKRLSRGLGLLRERLDAEHEGDCGPWLAAFLLPALPGSRGPAASASQGAGGTSAAFAVGTASLLVAGLALLAWWLVPRGDPAPGTAPRNVAQAPAAIRSPDPAGADTEERHRLAARTPPASPAAPSRFALTPPGVRLVGRLVDDRGQPLGQVRVRFEPDARGDADGASTRTAFSDPDGGFAIDGVRGPGRVLAASSRWVTLVAGDASGPLQQVQPVVVAAPAGLLAGRVLDSAGSPVAGARLELIPPSDLAVRLGVDLTTSWPLRTLTDSDDEGRFRLERLPRSEGTRLRLGAAGYRTRELPLPGDGEDLRLVLQRPDARLTGRVRDAEDRPLAGARLGWGGRLATSEADGSFSLWCEPEALAGEAAPEQLTVLAEGLAPLQLQAPRDGEGRRRWPPHLELRLDGPPGRLEGVVLDARGEAVPGAWVWIEDPTLFHAGADQEGATERLRAAPLGADPGPLAVAAEWVLAGEPAGRWARVQSDAEGRFQLEGLAPRPYRVAALTRRSLVRGRAGPVTPGAPLQVVLPTDRVHAELLAQVVDRAGRPLPDVLVETRTAGGELAHTTWIVTGRTARSDASGHVRLGATAASGEVQLRLDGPGLLPSDVPVPPLATTGTLRLVATARRDLRVLLDDPGAADRFAVEDRDGQRLPLYDLRHDRRQALPSAPLVAGRSAVLAVADHAARLVLLDDERPVRSLPLRLLPDQLNLIR